MKAPISLCMIVKNEAPRLENALNIIKEYVSQIVIIDTGSSDETPTIAKKYADVFEIFTACNDSETGFINDFSMARNRSFELANQPWIVWQDADDIIQGVENFYSLIQELELLNTDRPIAVLAPYHYSHDERGAVRVRQYRERLFSNKVKNSFQWVNKIHEVVNFNNLNTLVLKKENITWIHNRGNKQIEPNRNYRIIKKVVDDMEKSGNIDARQYYYACLEYFNVGESEKAVELAKKYISISGWSDEIYCCLYRVSQYYMSIGNYQEVINYSLKAISYQETWSEAYLMLAKAYYLLAEGGFDPIRNYQKCVNFTKQGLSFPPTETLLFVDPMDRSYEIHKFYNVALSKLGDIEGALESCFKGLQANPEDPWLSSNKKMYQKHLTRLKFNKETKEMLDCGGITQESYDKIMAVLDNPELLKVNNYVNHLDYINSFKEAGSHIENCFLTEDKKLFTELNQKLTRLSEKLDIIFYLGDGLEEWSPETIKKTGIGGSELMAMEMAKGLATLGHRVRLYNSCGPLGEGIYDKVEYLRSDKFINTICDILIVSRCANMLDDVYCTAKLKIGWAHDVVFVNPTNRLLLKADCLFALSKWHKQNLISQHNIHNDHIIVTRNGIHPERFEQDILRNSFKIVNSSSPDRGWVTLLDCWDEIKSKVPQAELHLYYGFNNWEAMAKINPQRAAPALALRDRALSMKNKDIIFHGRISQDELAKEFLSAGVWAHGTWFTETSCISAMEAQCAGLRCITTDLAALSETVINGIKIPGDCYSEEYKKIFIKEIINALTRKDDSDRKKIQQAAGENFNFKTLVKEWESIFYKKLAQKKIHPCLPYQPTESYR